MEGKKWRVLIADDEYRIGMLIQKLINWDEIGLVCENVVTDGESAYQAICETRPDIVITDIRMPKLSGLDLIRMTQEKYANTKFVVVSGYREFEYAHSALQYGVENYLLKPINGDELNRVMKRLVDTLDGENAFRLEQIKLQEAKEERDQIIKRDYLKIIIEQEDPREDAMNVSINMEGDIYRGIDVKLDYVDYSRHEKKQDRLTVEKIIDIIEGSLKGLAAEVLLCEKENLHLYCLVNYNGERCKEMRGRISQILAEIKNYLIGFEQYEVTIGVGTERNVFSEIRFSIKEANIAVQNRLRLGTGRLIYAESLEPYSCDSDILLPESFARKLTACVESYSSQQLEQWIQSVYSHYKDLNTGCDACYCYQLADVIVEEFFDRTDMDREAQDLIRKRLREQIQHCYTVTMLKNLLKRELGGCLNAQLQNAEAESAKPIRQAKKYMEEHYQEKIVLEDLADLVGLNPVYFSVRFKKETNMNFSAYLLDLRMEKAKELLCNTNETIAAIGDTVGYKDSRYFSQMFAKHVGVKPALYRKLHS